MMKCPISPSQRSSFSPFFLLHHPCFDKLSREGWKYLWYFILPAVIFILSYSISIKMKNKENGGCRGRTEEEERAGKEEKDAQLLKFPKQILKTP